jgi:hypothetical protein
MDDEVTLRPSGGVLHVPLVLWLVRQGLALRRTTRACQATSMSARALTRCPSPPRGGARPEGRVHQILAVGRALTSTGRPSWARGLRDTAAATNDTRSPTENRVRGQCSRNLPAAHRTRPTNL